MKTRKSQKFVLAIFVLLSTVTISSTLQKEAPFYPELSLEIDSESEDQAKTKALIAIIKKGKDEWNNYRKAHADDNFGDLLKESDLSGMDFNKYNLSMINLKEANLKGANFSNANMSGINLEEANVEGAIFKNANLSNANMKELRILRCNLQEANLSGANLKEVTAEDSDFSESNLSGTIMSEATIKNCNFKGAISNSITSFPAGFDLKLEGIEIKD